MASQSSDRFCVVCCCCRTAEDGGLFVVEEAGQQSQSCGLMCDDELYSGVR